MVITKHYSKLFIYSEQQVIYRDILSNIFNILRNMLTEIDTHYLI